MSVNWWCKERFLHFHCWHFVREEFILVSEHGPYVEPVKQKMDVNVCCYCGKEVAKVKVIWC